MAALKSKNTTQMIIEVNLFNNFIRNRFFLTDSTVGDPESSTFVAIWRATHAQPSWSAYLHSSSFNLTGIHNVLICFAFDVIIL